MRTFIFLSLLASTLLAGCANMNVPPADAYWLKGETRPAMLSPVDSSLAYYAYVNALGAADWARENENLKEALGKNASEFNRLRQIMLLWAAAAPQREHARAAQLLITLEKDMQKSASPLLPLLQLLRGELDERRRLEDKLRDESRRNAELEQKLDIQKAAEKDLQQKLEALKAIEKNLSERRRVPQAVSKP